MDKKLRLKFTNAFSKHMASLLPEFAIVKIKSMYVWPAESVWRKDTDEASYFVVLTPEPKGQSDKMTIELGWSRLKRFPELTRRPWLPTSDDIESHKLEEGTIRLGAVTP